MPQPGIDRHWSRSVQVSAQWLGTPARRARKLNKNSEAKFTFTFECVVLGNQGLPPFLSPPVHDYGIILQLKSAHYTATSVACQSHCAGINSQNEHKR